EIAKSLLGKVLCTCTNGIITKGVICETEAYAGINDRASHAYMGKHTQRTAPMYEEGGIAYVYLCYGIHHLFNVVTNKSNVPHAVLIRGIIPNKGIEIMSKRLNKSLNEGQLVAGPGLVSKALNITTSQTGINLSGNEIWIEHGNQKIFANQIESGPRIGV